MTETPKNSSLNVIKPDALNEKDQNPANYNSVPDRKCPFKSGLTFPSKSAIQGQNGAASPVGQNIIGYLPENLVETLPILLFDRNRKPDKSRKEPHLDQAVVKINNGDNVEKYFKSDLDFSRLNDIHKQLWMCGRPLNARPLHLHLLLGRRIFVAEKADYHLLTYSDIIMVKPLPPYLLSQDVWQHYLCKTQELYESARGLLLSYIWILRSEHDFNVAQSKDLHLLPKDLTWQLWRQIALESLNEIDADTLDQVNKRFQFGELRLPRINKIYRLHPHFILSHYVRGYMYGYNRYAPFFQRNVSWILGVSVLFSLVLSAMQVGAAVDPLRGNAAFNKASYGFVVFVCALVVVVLAFVIFVFCSIYLYNMVAAIKHSIVQQRDRHRLAKHKRETKGHV